METNVIIQGDCLEVMRGMEDNCVDLTVTSPPYDNLRDYKGYSFDFNGISEQLFRITKQGGVVVWVVGDATIKGNETGTSFRQALYFKDIGFNLHDTMIYHKYGMPMRGSLKAYNQTFEYMFVLCKGEIKTVNIIKDRPNATAGTCRVTTNRKADGKVNNQGLCKTEELGRRENLWSYNNGYMQTATDRVAFGHPALFPEPLAKDHIVSWSNKGDVVLDPFSGGGTTCKMAELMGRRYIGIEISEEYCEIARKRVQKAKDSMGLFND